MTAEPRAASLARVWSVVWAARRVADPRDPLGRTARERLPPTTGLSPQGVELALGRHLETRPHPADVARLVRNASTASRCWIVLAANVCTAALRAIAWATATAPEVMIRPSRRDPVVAQLLVEALQGCHDFAHASGRIRIVETAAPAPGDELHVYGSDATLSAMAARVGPEVRLRGHGTGIGVALVERRWDCAAAAAALADDIIPFDQRGCLSPRFALVEGNAERATRFGRALHEALSDRGRRVPRGPLPAADRAEVIRYRATAEALGPCWSGAHHLVAVDVAPRALLLPPAARCLLVAPVSADELGQLLAPWVPQVAAVGGAASSSPGTLTARAAVLAPRARRSELGHMQRPPLDGPVDLRPTAAAPRPTAGARRR